MSKDNKKSAPDFEKSLKALESLVEKLEKGDMPLEKALKAFEDGVSLTRHCQTALKEAEQKVEVLLGDREDLQPFDHDENQ